MCMEGNKSLVDFLSAEIETSGSIPSCDIAVGVNSSLSATLFPVANLLAKVLRSAEDLKFSRETR